MPSLTPSTLPLAIGIIEILLGTAMLAFPIPAGWGLPAVPPALLTAYGTGFVFFGVIAFILHVTQGTLPGLWRVVGNLLIVLPLLAAARSALLLGAVVGGTAYLALALVNVTAAALSRPEGGRGRFAVDGLIVTVLLFEGAAGVLLLTVPSAFRVPIYRDLLTYRQPVAGLFLLGAAVLLVGTLTRRPAARIAAGLVAAVPLILVPITIIRGQGQWPGVFVYPILAAFLVAHPWLERSLLAQIQAVTERPAVGRFQRTSEGIAWAVILLVTIAGNTQPAAADRVPLYALALGASLFTLVWFRLPPAAHPLRRTLWGTIVYTILAGLVMHLTGGIRTPLIFLLLLPIMAAAWALPPNALLIPTAIALGFIGVEAAWHIRGGEPGAEVLTTAVFRASGVLFVAVFALLLARRAAEHRALLRREKEKLEGIVGSMDEGLIVLDRDGRVQFCNAAALKLLQRPAAALVGRRIQEVLTIQREDGLEWREGDHPLAAAVDRGQGSQQRVLASGPGDTTPRPYALTLTPFELQGGRPSGVICSLREVGAEIEMARMREDFFNIASHEIRTPLTVIKGHVELALDGSLGPLGETATHVLTEIHTATARLIRMVNDFLDAARVEQGKIAVVMDRGSLPALVEQAVDTMAPDARRKGLTLTYHLPDPAAVPPVLMDAGKALQVLINLIDNGIKFTARGGVELWHEVEGGKVATYVRDSGAGIRPEERHYLFERFSQLGRGLRRETGGSGLGLYISRKLAEHMHGTVYLKESVPDAGSTFVFELPLAGEAVRAEGGATRERTGTR